MNTNCKITTKREKEKQNLLREFDSYLLDHTSPGQATRIYNAVLRNTELLCTKDEFVKFFEDDSLYVYGLGDKSLALVRDFLGIKETVTVKKDDTLEKEIYSNYLSGTTLNALCIKYGLQDRVVAGIISKFNKVYIERQNYMYEMYEYLYEHLYPAIAIRSLKILNDYIVSNYNMGIYFSKKDLIELINSDTNIRGIRKVVLKCMREFVSK